MTRLFRYVSSCVKKHYLWLGCLVFMLLLSCLVFMLLFFLFWFSTIGPNSPTAGGDDASTGTTTTTWRNFSNMFSSDNSYTDTTNNVNIGLTTYYLRATGFNFSIPTGATINGISVGIEKKAWNAGFYDNAVRIIKNGEIGTTDKSNINAWPTLDGTGTYGSSSDLRWTGWTSADINNPNFGFAISAINSGATNSKPSVDWINITVTYTPDTTPPTFAGVTSWATYTGVRIWTWTYTWNVIITFADESLLSWATLDGAPYVSWTAIRAEWTHVFVVTDAAGNSTGATFTIQLSFDQKIFNDFVLNLWYVATTTSILPLAEEVLLWSADINASEFSGNLLTPIVMQSSVPYSWLVGEVQVVAHWLVTILLSWSTYTGVVHSPVFQNPSIYSWIFGTTPLSALSVWASGAHIALTDTFDNPVYAIVRMPVPGATANDLMNIYDSDNGSNFVLHAVTVVRLIGGDPYVVFPTSHFSVFVTVPNNGLAISADKASNSASWSAYTLLDDVVIAEVLNNDFAASQTDATLILTAPANWQFKPGSGSVSYIGTPPWQTDITGASLVVTSWTATITFSTDGVADKFDTLTIAGLQLQALSGNIIPSVGEIYRTCANLGTANIVGVSCDSTPFWSLIQEAGTANRMITTLPGQTFVAGIGNSGTALSQSAGVSFDISKLTAVDQFNTIATSYAWNKTISYAGPLWAYTTGVSFVDGQSTTLLHTTLTQVWTWLTIASTDGTLSGLASSSFAVLDVTPPTFSWVMSWVIYTGSVSISFSDDNPWVTATLNGNAYIGGTLIAVNWTYVFIVTDSAGNSTWATFSILATTTSVWGGWGGWAGIQKDTCSKGDLSPSVYDGTCEASKIMPQGFSDAISWTHAVAWDITNSPFSTELNAAYLYAFAHGITTMNTIQKADMEWNLIRAHMAKMIVNYAIRVLGKVPNTWLICEFSDMSAETPEMQFYARFACKLGLMWLNDDGTPSNRFYPNNRVTRAQFGTVLSRVLYDNTYNSDLLNGSRYGAHLQALKTAGIMTRINQPLMRELRGYVMLMLMRAVWHQSDMLTGMQ